MKVPRYLLGLYHNIKRLIMEMVRMITGLDQSMSRWRMGEISNSEIMAQLLAAMAEVQMDMQVAEELEAERALSNA